MIKYRIFWAIGVTVTLIAFKFKLYDIFGGSASELFFGLFTIFLSIVAGVILNRLFKKTTKTKSRLALSLLFLVVFGYFSLSLHTLHDYPYNASKLLWESYKIYYDEEYVTKDDLYLDRSERIDLLKLYAAKSKFHLDEIPDNYFLISVLCDEKLPDYATHVEFLNQVISIKGNTILAKKGEQFFTFLRQDTLYLSDTFNGNYIQVAHPISNESSLYEFAEFNEPIGCNEVTISKIDTEWRRNTYNTYVNWFFNIYRDKLKQNE